jgi:xanthine dehydrogenase accessory factor
VADQPLSWSSDAITSVLEQRRFADLATVVAAPPASGVEVGAKLLVERDSSSIGSLGSADLDQAVVEDARSAMDERRSRVVSYPVPGLAQPDGGVLVFHEVLEPQPQLLIIGAGHIAVPLAHFGKTLGFEVVVLDDRDKYANRERFPGADQIIAADFGGTLRDFPLTAATYVVIITRAHTYDEESLRLILDKPAAYIGMIGSRRRVQTVLRTLTSEGYDRERLSAIHAPIGLDIGSETPEEIALAIIAEVVTVRRGGTGVPLSKQIRPVSMEAAAGP